MLAPNLVTALARQAVGGANPVYCHYFVTHRCGLACEFCSVPEQASGPELTLPEVRQLAGVLASMGVGLVNLGGGEAMLRPDLPEIAQVFTEAGFAVRLQTSGFWATEAKVQRLVEAGVSGVSISIDSFREEIEDRVIGRKDTLRKIADGIALFHEQLAGSRVLCMLNIVVTRLNYRELPLLVELARYLGWQCSFGPLHQPKPGRELFAQAAPDLAFRPEDYAELTAIYEELLRLKSAGAPIANSSSFLRSSLRFLRGEGADWTCSAGRKYLLVRPDGRFSPCTDFVSEENLLAAGFLEHYRSPEFDQTVLAPVRSCDGCSYPCWSEMERFWKPEVVAERLREQLRGTVNGLLRSQPRRSRSEIHDAFREFSRRAVELVAS